MTIVARTAVTRLEMQLRSRQQGVEDRGLATICRCILVITLLVAVLQLMSTAGQVYATTDTSRVDRLQACYVSFRSTPVTNY